MFVTTVTVALIGFLVWMLVAFALRKVVPTNEVHIVQSAKQTISYGKDHAAGNTYYKVPSWIPRYGVTTIMLPVSNFDQDLPAYDAYDRGRVPFVVDIKAFFRIDNPEMAAQRVSSFNELLEQLRAILQGAIRSILASKDIEEILQGRSEIGTMFTEEVDEQLKQWGVSTVKNIELMDIRDSAGSQVIANIMEKKKSLIEKESRIEVANNKKEASIAEISAARDTEIQRQAAAQQIGERTAQKDQAIGIANEQAQQNIKEQQKVTTEKEIAVVKVAETGRAQVQREVQVIAANQQRETEVIKAEGQKQTTVLVAEGNLQSTRLEAEGIQAEGVARADAEKAMQLAPVEAQIVLAKEIGENQGYQQYLISVRTIEKDQVVGIEQAKALSDADIKVIANSGDVNSGMNSVMDLLSAKGGTALGAAVEAFKQTPAGEALLNNIGK